MYHNSEVVLLKQNNVVVRCKVIMCVKSGNSAYALKSSLFIVRSTLTSDDGFAVVGFEYEVITGP